MAEEPVMTAVAVKMNLNMVMGVLGLLPLFSFAGKSTEVVAVGYNRAGG